MRGAMMLVLTLCIIGAVWANDTAIQGAGGTVVPLAGEHAAIHLVNEAVRLEISPRYYDVQAEFLFQNTGADTTVMMGFPETVSGSGYAQYHDRTALLSFCATVDGQPVTAQRQLGTAPHEMSYMAWWTKEVSFAAGQQRRVTVAYRAPVGEGTWGERWALYHFTGGNWAGTVGRSHLQVRLHLNGMYAVQSSIPLVEERDGFSARWHDWEAEETATINFQPCEWSDLAVRGLDIPREEDHSYWLSPRLRILHLRAPGITDPDGFPFVPAAFYTEYDGGQTYISAYALQIYLAARCPAIPSPTLSWDTETHEAIFSYLGERVRFHAERNQIANPNAQTAIIRDKPTFGEQAGHLYLPANAVARAFGLRTETHYANNQLQLTFPTPQSCLTVLEGKPYRVRVGGEGGALSLLDLTTGQVVASYPYPAPARVVTAGMVPPPVTIDRYLLLPYGLDGVPELRCYDLQQSLQTHALSEVWKTTCLSADSTILPAADQQAVYLLVTAGEQRVVEKRALADGALRWQTALPDVSGMQHVEFIAEQDGQLALLSAQNTDEGLADPAEVLLLDAATGALHTRYWCGLADAVPARLPRWAAGPKDIRAVLNADGQLYVATYGQGLWRSSDGKTWTRVAGEQLPAYLTSLAAGTPGVVAGTWMADGLLVQTPTDPAFLHPWPNRPRWPSWWNREYSRCMAVGFCGDALYVQTWGGFLRWTMKAGWEHPDIPAGDSYAVINDSGIWTATAEGRTTRLRHYTPAGTRDFDLPLHISTSALHALTVADGVLYLLHEDGSIITGTPAQFREYVTALATGRFPQWLPTLPWTLRGFGMPLEPGHTLAGEQALLVYTAPGDRPVLLAGTSRGVMLAQANADGPASATLDPSLVSNAVTLTTYRDTTGEWLVLGGTDAIVLLPISTIRAALTAERMRK